MIVKYRICYTGDDFVTVTKRAPRYTDEHEAQRAVTDLNARHPSIVHWVESVEVSETEEP